MVGSHFKKLSAGASPGFDGIPIPFLKYACLPIERGRKVDYVNALVPLIACMLEVFLSDANIPACWKVAKLSPLHKKGAMSNPGNYRRIAVSGVLHLKHAVIKLKLQPSPRQHAAFIDFSQAYDTVLRLQLWDHLQRIAMPAPLLRAIKEMYQDDE
eukprot:1145012-Pelagomonas_calceolata.AAC.1